MHLWIRRWEHYMCERLYSELVSMCFTFKLNANINLLDKHSVMVLTQWCWSKEEISGTSSYTVKVHGWGKANRLYSSFFILIDLEGFFVGQLKLMVWSFGLGPKCNESYSLKTVNVYTKFYGCWDILVSIVYVWTDTFWCSHWVTEIHSWFLGAEFHTLKPFFTFNCWRRKMSLSSAQMSFKTWTHKMILWHHKPMLWKPEAPHTSTEYQWRSWLSKS